MNINISVPRPLPPACYAAERGEGFDIPVYNRANRIIGYRQSVRTLRDLGADVVMPMHLDIRPFRQPITKGAEDNLHLLLLRSGFSSCGWPNRSSSPMLQAYQRFGRTPPGGEMDWSLYKELFETVLPDEFLGTNLSGRELRPDCLRVRAYGLTYEIRDRPRYIAFRVDEHSSHVAHGAGWSSAEALADGARRWPHSELSTTVATPDLMISIAVRGIESVSFTVVGELAVHSGERRTYTDEYWDYQGNRLGWW